MATPYNPLSRRFVMMNMAGLLACLCVTFPFTIVNSGLRKHDPKKSPEKGTRFSLKSIGKMYYERYWLEANFEAVNRLKTIARGFGKSLPQFALAWVLNNETVTSVICGCSALKQLEQNLGAVEIKLSEEELAACDEVWKHLRPLRFFYGR